MNIFTFELYQCFEKEKSPKMVYSTVYFVSFQQDYNLKTNMFSSKHQHSIAPPSKTDIQQNTCFRRIKVTDIITYLQTSQIIINL